MMELAEPAFRHQRNAMLVDAAARHAAVARLDHDRDALRLEHLVERLRDLAGQPLLKLQPPRESVNEARELRNPHDAAGGAIGDVGLAHDRREMMLASRNERNVAQ